MLSYCFNWPQVLTPALGFFGVILTLFVNAKLARRAREIERSHKRAGLASALSAELEILRAAFVDLVQATKRNKDFQGELIIPIESTRFVFDESVRDLGILPAETTRAVVNAYVCLAEFERSLVLVLGVKAKLPDQPYIAACLPEFEKIGQLSQSMVEHFDSALTALKAALATTV